VRAALAVLLALAALPAAALAAEARTTLPDVEDEVMCVTCNVPLNIAESPQASRQRELIRTLVDRGLTKEQVKAALVDEYGEDVLAMPEDDGVGIAAYVVPIALVVAMIAAAAFVLPRWRRRPAAGGAAGGASVEGASDAELRRLDEDLARYE
jgi:cytochrome c-type biogenesis protein CcmH/NrfF